MAHTAPENDHLLKLVPGTSSLIEKLEDFKPPKQPDEPLKFGDAGDLWGKYDTMAT
ncbi:hypothetical protein FRB97_002456, partial [Tulasnella sp. 331]